MTLIPKRWAVCLVSLFVPFIIYCVDRISNKVVDGALRIFTYGLCIHHPQCPFAIWEWCIVL